ncbi:MAG: hypothetical protein ABWY78_03845 [Microvirga sp.]
MWKATALVAVIVLAVPGFPSQGARAQGLTCAASADTARDWPAIAGLIDPTTGRTADARVAALVQQYQTNGLDGAVIVNRLVNAYCTGIAGISGVSDSQRAELTRRFARQVTGYVYAGAPLGQISILVDVPLSQAVLDRVDAAASAKGVSQDRWIADAIEKTLGAN